MIRGNPATGIPCPECDAKVGDWCYTYGSLHHPCRTSLALVLTTHPPDVDPVDIIREASGIPDSPLWDCVAKIHRRWDGGIRRWLGDVGLVYSGAGAPLGYAGLPIWFPIQGGHHDVPIAD